MTVKRVLDPLPASNVLARPAQPAFPANEEDVCDLWKAMILVSAPTELLARAQGLMASLPDDERRKNLCGILLADYLDPEYCPVPFFLQDKELAPEDLAKSLLEVQIHLYALQTWHDLLRKISAH